MGSLFDLGVQPSPTTAFNGYLLPKARVERVQYCKEWGQHLSREGLAVLSIPVSHSYLEET